MIYLFPIRVAVYLIVGVPLIVSYAISEGLSLFYSNVHVSFYVLYYASVATFVAIGIAAHHVWKTSPRIQAAYFPYIGGIWTGKLRFVRSIPPGNGRAIDSNQTNGSANQFEETRYCDMTINHNLLSIKIVLKTEESISETIFVSPRREVGNDQRRIYYIYNNERNPGVLNPGHNYRGAAALEIVSPAYELLRGEYFTDQRRGGKLDAILKSKHPKWAFWK